MPDHHASLDAALARNSGPSAEDVDLAAWLRDWRLADCEHAEVRDGGIICCSPCLRDRILTSDWLTAHTTAAEARGAERGARAVVEALRSGMPTTAFDGRYRDGYAAGIFTAERAARAAAEQTGESDA